MSMSWRRRAVRSGAIDLAVFETDDNGPTLLFVHGYPDTHTVWDRVAALLASRYHCVAYDVRGAGASDPPGDRAGYHLSRLRDDLATVVAEVSPDAPVHLIGHDWGSIQGWDAVIRASGDSSLTAQLATYTTISGPCLEHVSAFRRTARAGDWRRRLEVLDQMRRSWYVFAFHVPWLPERVLSRLSRRKLVGRDPRALPLADTLPADSVHGLELYRANIFHREPLDRPPSTNVPVLLVVPTRDKYVSPAFTDDLGSFAHALTRVEIDAGHWVPRTHPDELADAIDEFVSRN